MLIAVFRPGSPRPPGTPASSGFAGLREVTGAPPGAFTLSSAAETAERLEQVRRQARDRASGALHPAGASGSTARVRVAGAISGPPQRYQALRWCRTRAVDQ